MGVLAYVMTEPSVSQIWWKKNTHCIKEVSGQVHENISVGRAPIVDDCILFHRQIPTSPREIGKQIADLLMCAQFAGDELSRAQRIR